MTTKKIGSLHQGIVFNELAKFVPEIRPTTVDSWGYNEINFFHNTLHGKIPSLDINFFGLKFLQNEYSEWLNTSYNIFFQSDVKNIPKLLTNCEALFDKNILRIKKLVHDIGDVSKLIHKDIYDDSNIITHKFVREVNNKL